MKRTAVCAFVVAVVASVAAIGATQDEEPFWAWGFTTAPDPGLAAPTVASVQPAPRNGPPRESPTVQLTGSKFTFKRSELNDSYNPADWFPDEHPKMPE